MNFKKLLNVADSNRVAAQSEASVKRYSTILAPPKKPPKSSVQSDAIKRFLAKKDEEERLKALEERKKKQELLCLRSQNSKNSKKAKIMASRTKDNDFSRIRMTDDEVIAKKEREAKLLRMSLNSKMDRMKARIELEENEKLLPHKRKRKLKTGDAQDIEINENHIYSENRKQNNFTLNFQDETNNRFSSAEINKRMRSKAPSGSAPPVNFNDLLKIAATKQYQPVELPEVEVSDTEDRPLTKRERSQLLAEKVRLKRKLSNGEQNLTINKNDTSHVKNKPIVVSDKHIQYISKTQGASQELSKSNVNLHGIDDRGKIIPHINDSRVAKRYPGSSSEAVKSFTANKGSRNILNKSDAPKVSLNQQANIKANIHKNNLERNSLVHKLQNHQQLPSRQKVINKPFEKYVDVQNDHKIPSTDAVKRKQSAANNSAQGKVPHSYPQQNAVLAKSVSIRNISERGKSTFPNSRNTFNNSKGKNISSSNGQSMKTTSHPKTLSEHRPNNTIENIKRSSAKGADLMKSSSCGYRLSSSDLFSDKGSKLSKSSAINSNSSSSRELHSSAVHKNTVISSKVPGKTPNIRSVVGNNSHKRDSGQYATCNDLRIKSNGKPLLQSQERVQNVKRVPEHPLTKTKGLVKPSLQDHSTPVSKFNTKSEIVKKPPLSSTKMPFTKPTISSEYPPTRPPSSLKSSAVRSLPAALPTARPVASSGKLPPPKPPIKSSYPRNPYLDPPRRLLESQRPQRMPLKRKIESDEEDEDDDMSDFIDDGPTDDPADVSKYIKEIFNYDRSRYIDDDDDDVMETTFAEQMKEEFRSAKLGLLEDLEDMRKEEEEKKRKKKKMKK